MKIIEHIILIIRVRSKLPGSTVLPRLTVYNNVGLTSKASEESRRESTEIAVFDNPTVV